MKRIKAVLIERDDWYLRPDGPWGPQVTVDAGAIKPTMRRAPERGEYRELTVRDVGGYLLAFDPH